MNKTYMLGGRFVSADNGVYILKTNDNQIRVAHSYAIDGLFNDNGEYISKQIKMHFGDTPYTKNMGAANRIAKKIYRNLHVCEHGIQVLPYCSKTWKQIEEES